MEEIDDVDGNSTDPFVAAAVANERELELSEQQNRHFKKVYSYCIIGYLLRTKLKYWSLKIYQAVLDYDEVYDLIFKLFKIKLLFAFNFPFLCIA